MSRPTKDIKRKGGKLVDRNRDVGESKPSTRSTP